MLAKQLNAMENKVFRISNRCIGSYNCESSMVEQDGSDSISFAGIESIKSSSGLELFACSACGQVFTSVMLVQDHLKEHMLDQSAKCFHCGLIFPDHAELDTHMTRHTQSVTKKNEVKISEAGTVYNFLTEVIGQQDLNEADLQKNTLERKPQKLLSKYFCPACNDCFDTYLALNKHLLVHKDTEFFKCATCEKVFITLVDFNNHLQTQCILPKSTLVNCQVCSRSFSSAAKLSQHKLCHNTDKIFLCSDCGQKFSKKRSYLDHIIKHAVEAKGAKEQQPDKLFCETCNKTFSSSQVLKKHLQTHDGSVYTCTECKFVFDSRRAFVSHQKKHLRGVNNFICQLCGSNFNQKSDLNLHVRKEHRDNRPWACDLCDLTFSAKFDLTRHKLKHQGRKFYSCQFCKREFYARADLKQHEASIHSTVPREKHFMCHECGKLFYTRGHLNTHRQAHSTAQPFSCPECPARFKTKKNMAVHMRRHTGELPIKCSICGQGFLDHCYLSRHMVRHKLAPDLHCLLCKKSFFQQQQLKTHMTMTHFLCFDCEARFDTRKEIIAHRKNCLFPGSAAYLSRRGVSPATSAVIVEPVNPGGNILRPGSMDGCSNFADTLTATSGTDCLESTLAAAQIQSRNLESGTYSEQFSQHDTNTKTFLLRNEHKTMHISMSVCPDVLHRFPRSIETQLAENGEQVMTDNDDSSKMPALSSIKKEDICVPDPAQELEIEASEETIVQKFGHKIGGEDTISVEKKCKHKKWDKRRRNSGLTKEPNVGEQSSLGLQISADTCISGSQSCVVPEVSSTAQSCVVPEVSAHKCAGSKDKLQPFQEPVSPTSCTDSITNINQKTYLTKGTEPLSTSAECERISLTATTAGQIDSKNTFSLSEGMHTVSEKANLKEVHNLVFDVLHCLMSNPVPSSELNRTTLQATTTDFEVQMETFRSNVEDEHNSATLVTSISTDNKSDSHSECTHSTSDFNEVHVLVLDALKNPTNKPVTLPEFNGTVLQRGQNADVEVQRGMFGSNGEVEHNSSGLQTDVCTKNKSYSRSESTHFEAEKANLQEMHNLVCDVMKRPESNSVAVSELNSRVMCAGQATDIEVQMETFRSGNEVGCNSASLDTKFSIENRSNSLSQNTDLTKVSDIIKDARSSVVSSEFNRSVKNKTTVVERQMGTFGSGSETEYDSSALEINIAAENKSKHVALSCKSMKNAMGTEDSNLNELEVDFVGDVIAVSESSANDSQQHITTSSISMREEETNIQKAHDLVNIDCVTNMEHFIYSHCQQEYETCEASSRQHTCLKEKSTVSIKSTVGIKPRNQVFVNTDSRSLLIKLPPAQHSSFQPESTSLTNTPASLLENEKSGHIGSDSSVEITNEKSIKIVCTPIQVISSGQRINISLSQPPPKDTFEMIGQQMLMKPGVKKFKCYYCNASFPTIKTVITHSQLHFPKQAVASSISSAPVASMLATGSPPKPATTVQGPAVRHNILHLSNNTPIYVRTEKGIEDEQSTLLPKIWISLPPSQSSVRSKVISLQGGIPSIINEHLPPPKSPTSSSTITNTVYSRHAAVPPQQPVTLNNSISEEKNGKGEVAYAQPFSVKTCAAALQQSLVKTYAAPLHPVNNVVVASDLSLDVSHPDKCKICDDDLADEPKKEMESCVKFNVTTSQFENGIKKKSAANALNNSDIEYGTALACNINEINHKTVSSSLEKDFTFEKNSHAPEMTDTKRKMCELGESSLLFQCSDCRDCFCTLSEFAAHAKKQHKMSMPHPGHRRSFLKQQKQRLDKTEEGVLKNELDKNSRTLSMLKETDGKLVSHDSEQKSDQLQKGASEDTATSALQWCAGSPDRDLENGIHNKRRSASTLATFPESCHQPGPKHGRMSVMELAAAAEVVEDTLWQLDHPYKCDVCSTSFSYFSQIMHHLDSSHGRQELYQCSHCIGVFSSLASLTVHFQMHAQLMAGLTADTITTQSNCSYKETGIDAGKSQEQFSLAKHKDKEDDSITEISDNKAHQDQIAANHQSTTRSASTKGRFSRFLEVADAKSKTSGIAHLSLDRMHTPEHFSHGLTLESLAEAAVALAESGERLGTSRQNLVSQSPRKISPSLGTKSTWEASYTVGGQTFIILVSLPVSAHVALSQSSALPDSTSSQTKDSYWQQKSQPETTSDGMQILQDSALSTLPFADQHGAKKSKKIFKCMDRKDLCLEAIGDLEDPECSQTNIETCRVPQYTAKNMDSHHIVNTSQQIKDVQISNTEIVLTAKKDLVESGNHKYTSVTQKRVTPSDRCKLEITSDSDDIEILSADESVDDNFMPIIEFPSEQSLSQCQKASHLYEVVSSDQSDICPHSIKTLTQNSSSNLENASICSSLHSDLNVDMNAEDREVSMSDCKLRRGSLCQKVLQSKQRLFHGEFRSRIGCIKNHPISSYVKSKAHNTSKNCKSSPSLSLTDHSFVQASSETETPGLKDDLLVDSGNHFHCELCRMSFTLKSQLDMHVMNHCSLHGAFSCRSCEREFRSYAHLVTHLLQHVSGLPFFCSQCTAAFNHQAALQTHLHTHQKDHCSCIKSRHFHTPKSDLQEIHRNYCFAITPSKDDQIDDACTQNIMSSRKEALFDKNMHKVKEIDLHQVKSKWMNSHSNCVYAGSCIGDDADGDNDDYDDIVVESNEDTFNSKNCRINLNADKRDNATASDNSEKEDSETFIKDHDPFSQNDDTEDERGGLKLYKPQVQDEKMFVTNSNSAEIVNKEKMDTENPLHTQPEQDLKSVTLAAQQHMQPSQRKKRVVCHLCGRNFCNNHYLKLHILKHEANQQEGKECPYCGRSFYHDIALRAHMKRHTIGFSFVCDTCGKAYKDKYTLKWHKKHHAGERRYPCPVCQKQFSNRSDMEYHHQSHDSGASHPRPRPFHCLTCGKRFSRQKYLNLHSKRHDRAVVPFVCSTCGIARASKRALEVHECSHTGERPHKCSHCGQGFVSATSLARHKFTHTGHTPFTCKTCGKSFLRKDGLQQHEARHAMSDVPKQFVCDFCGKVLRSKSGLMTHLRSHSSIKNGVGVGDGVGVAISVDNDIGHINGDGDILYKEY